MLSVRFSLRKSKKAACQRVCVRARGRERSKSWGSVRWEGMGEGRGGGVSTCASVHYFSGDRARSRGRRPFIGVALSSGSLLLGRCAGLGTAGAVARSGPEVILISELRLS